MKNLDFRKKKNAHTAYLGFESTSFFQEMLTLEFEPATFSQEMLTLEFEPIFAKKCSHGDLNPQLFPRNAHIGNLLFWTKVGLLT